MWGIIPAAGHGSRIQPLAFSKELLPVGSRFDGHVERPQAVSEYLVERMLTAGATRLCFVISPGKSDILEYYGASVGGATIAYTVQPAASGLCDALFRALPLIDQTDEVLFGLPDTIWFPEDGFCHLPPGRLSFLLFPCDQPQFFDAVETDREGRVVEIRVKRRDVTSRWIWGAARIPGAVLHELRGLWTERQQVDEYFGTLINAWIQDGGEAWGLACGEAYVDVGTVDGYRQGIQLLSERASDHVSRAGHHLQEEGRPA